METARVDLRYERESFVMKLSIFDYKNYCKYTLDQNRLAISLRQVFV